MAPTKKSKKNKKPITKKSVAKKTTTAAKKSSVKVAKKAITSKNVAKTAKTAKTAKKKAISTKLASKKATSVQKPVVTKPKGTAWLQPLDDRILVELVKIDEVSPGGIILVDSSIQPDNLQGVVLAIGRGHQNKKGHIRPLDVKIGDKIVFSKYAGDKISQDGVNFVVIRETEVLGFAAN